MHIHIISIFPEIFDNFINTSLIKKAKEKKILSFDFVNPRIFCPGKHQQVDDTIYGGGAGLLMKAKPAIDAVESIIKKIPLDKGGKPKAGGFAKKSKKKFDVILLSPSKDFFTQKQAHTLSNSDHIIFVCTRYE
jgi:tRNA (guanine37-N1)-methyltransferase